MAHNDNPFAVGDLVSVIRTRHGWHDGALKATIYHRYQNAQGTWSYFAKTCDGDDIEIHRTKDARKEK